MLAEIRGEGGADYSETPNQTGPQYGRVVYTHGGGLDQPLDIMRSSGVGGAASILLPIPTWRGTFVTATDSAGNMVCAPWVYCEITFTGAHSSAFLLPGAPVAGEYWYGSLAQGNENASGTIYMRNRYYNPQTGAFTQQDPIGLAGGLNTYGFANGDPVSYSDPYGLKVCFRGSPSERSRVESQTESAIGASIHLGRDGCVSRVGGSNSPARAQFKSLVDSDHTYEIAYGSGGSGYDPATRRIRIDEEGTLQPIYTWQNTDQGRECVNFAASFGFVARLIAHELGHAYHHESKWLGTFGFALVSRRRKEYYAMGWENLWARQNTQPDRCRYGRSF